jgi:adenosylcobinamide kinase / adenosylcobinamide-phosphate guanylyltransferase
MRELILGGQRSGKSARAEHLAVQWLSAGLHRKAVMIATAQAYDAEMQLRIERHRADRATRLPAMQTLEVPVDVAQAINAVTSPDTMVVIDCLALWLTNLLMPYRAEDAHLAENYLSHEAMLLQAVAQAQGPVVLVSNEIGLGVIPMGQEVRAYVDALGRLNQRMAHVCEMATLMVAGLPLGLKGN